MGFIYSRRNWKEDDYKRIAQMYIDGDSLKKIGKCFGVSDNTIRNRLKEIGLIKKTRGTSNDNTSNR